MISTYALDLGVGVGSAAVVDVDLHLHRWSSDWWLFRALHPSGTIMLYRNRRLS